MQMIWQCLTLMTTIVVSYLSILGANVQRAELEQHINQALEELVTIDRDLMRRGISERSLVARLAHHLQVSIHNDDVNSPWIVDVEFNRAGLNNDPKLLAGLEGCTKVVNGKSYIVADLIIHQRGPRGPNLMAIEVKKTSNKACRDCDRRRIEAFVNQLNYTFGARLELATRRQEPPHAVLVWYTSNHGWEAGRFQPDVQL